MKQIPPTPITDFSCFLPPEISPNTMIHVLNRNDQAEPQEDISSFSSNGSSYLFQSPEPLSFESLGVPLSTPMTIEKPKPVDSSEPSLLFQIKGMPDMTLPPIRLFSQQNNNEISNVNSVHVHNSRIKSEIVKMVHQEIHGQHETERPPVDVNHMNLNQNMNYYKMMERSQMSSLGKSKSLDDMKDISSLKEDQERNLTLKRQTVSHQPKTLPPRRYLPTSPPMHNSTLPLHVLNDNSSNEENDKLGELLSDQEGNGHELNRENSRTSLFSKNNNFRNSVRWSKKTDYVSEKTTSTRNPKISPKTSPKSSPNTTPKPSPKNSITEVNTSKEDLASITAKLK